MALSCTGGEITLQEIVDGVNLNETNLGTHESDTSNPHSVNLSDVGGTTDHTQLSNIGSNTHTQIDTHVGSSSNPHNVTAAQTGAALSAHTHAQASLTNRGHSTGSISTDPNTTTEEIISTRHANCPPDAQSTSSNWHIRTTFNGLDKTQLAIEMSGSTNDYNFNAVWTRTILPAINTTQWSNWIKLNVDYNMSSSDLSGATIFGRIIIENGLTTNITTRELKASDIGAFRDYDDVLHVGDGNDIANVILNKKDTSPGNIQFLNEGVLRAKLELTTAESLVLKNFNSSENLVSTIFEIGAGNSYMHLASMPTILDQGDHLLIQSGFSSNGYYYKFSNGLMIQFEEIIMAPAIEASGNVYRSANVEWSYPVAFIDDKVVVSATMSLTAQWTACDSTGTMGRVRAFASTNANTDANSANLTAIGRWR